MESRLEQKSQRRVYSLKNPMIVINCVVKEYTDIVDNFFAILDNPNGDSTLRMLMDQKEHIGYRTVERIVVFGYTEPKEMAEKVSTATCEGNWRADDIDRCSSKPQA